MFRAAAIVFLAPCLALAAKQPTPVGLSVPLAVKTGTPLRVYITKRVAYRQGAVVSAKLVEPVWSFDRIVIPAGAILQGEVLSLEPVPNMMRAMAVVRGDFTPLKRAEVTFNALTLPNGQRIEMETQPSVGLASIYVPPKPNKNVPKKSSRLRTLAKQQMETQINARTYGFLDFVRGPDKRDWVETFLWNKMPYHPQWYRRGTRFDAVLKTPLDFGTVNVSDASLTEVGRQRGVDLPALVQMTNTVSSADAKVGDPITGVLSQPLFSADHKLILPEGTDMHGRITLARRARMFHRGGQLRFTFDEVEPPSFLAKAMGAPEVERTQAQLTATEQGAGPVKVDSEGTAKATESKTRFLRPVIAGLVASRAADNDAGKQNSSGAAGGANANYSGHSLGGFSGFGLLGMAASFGPAYVGTALGYYGLGWSVYSNLVSRGSEVTFEKNSAIAIRFGAPKRGAK